MIGIDVGTKNIKLCCVEKKSEEFLDVYYDMEPLPQSPTAKDYSRIMKSMIKKAKVPKDEIITSVGDSEILIRKLDLPLMPKEELRSTIRLQAERLIYADLNEMDVDFHIRPGMQENRMDVIFVAVPKAVVDKGMEVIQYAGLNPYVMDVDNLAMANSFLVFEPEAYEKTVILVNIGHVKTCFTILCRGEFCFARNVGFGGKDIAVQIMKEMKIPYEKAEELKESPAKWSEYGLNIKNILRKSMPDVLEALYKSIEYCRSQRLIDKVDKIYLSGGVSCLDGIDAFLKSILDIEAEKWNSLRNIKLLRKKEQGEYMSVVLGIALRDYILG